MEQVACAVRITDRIIFCRRFCRRSFMDLAGIWWSCRLIPAWGPNRETRDGNE